MRIAAIMALCLPLLAVAQPVVPGFERFPSDTPAQQVNAGEVLITELNCVACHANDMDQGQRFQHRPAPILFTNQNPAHIRPKKSLTVLHRASASSSPGG